MLYTLPSNISDDKFEQPPQCMPDEYKVLGNSVLGYWNYYENEKHTVKNKDEQKIIRPHYINELCEH